MKRIVSLALFAVFTLSGCVVFAPPGQAKKVVGAKSSAEIKGEGVKVKVKAK